MTSPGCANTKVLPWEVVLVLLLPIFMAKNAELNLKTYPLAGKVVLDHCYIDDLMPSALTVDEAKEARRQLTE